MVVLCRKKRSWRTLEAVTRLEVREALAVLSVVLWDISVSALQSASYEVCRHHYVLFIKSFNVLP